jgi:Txe/YoeB family toxin of Txe-Axe toxin-antitoxin module
MGAVKKKDKRGERRKYSYSNDFFTGLIEKAREDLKGQEKALYEKLKAFVKEEDYEAVKGKIEKLRETVEGYYKKRVSRDLSVTDCEVLIKLQELISLRLGCKIGDNFLIKELREDITKNYEKAEAEAGRAQYEARMFIKKKVKNAEEGGLITGMLDHYMRQWGNYKASKMVLEVSDAEMASGKMIMDLIAVKRIKVVMSYSNLDYDSVTGANKEGL